MHEFGNAASSMYREHDALREALTRDLVDWEPRPDTSIPLLVKMVPRRIGGIRMIDFSGSPFGGSRSSAQIATDDDTFLGVLFQRTGRTYCEIGEERAIVGPGDISIWHSARALSFCMPDEFHKLCMLIPIERFETVLPNAASYAGVHLKCGSTLATLLGSFLTSLIENVVLGQAESTAAAMDVTLQLLGAALTSAKTTRAGGPRDALFERIVAFIDHRLDDAELSPSVIAEAHGISVRYLYVLFNERAATVSKWILDRRLARCRAELRARPEHGGITRIAHTWGFTDSAHFSRSFKAAFGLSPTAFQHSVHPHT